MRSKVWIAILALLAVGVVGAFAAYRQATAWMNSPIQKLSAGMVYDVPQGAALSVVLRDLEQRGLIEHRRELTLWLRYMRPHFQFKAGEYELSAGMTPIELVELLHSGKVIQHKLTIREGVTFKELRALLAQEPALKQTTSSLSNAELMQKLGSKYSHPEGWFFPDTQSFIKGSTDYEFLDEAYARMKAELDREWSRREPGLPLADQYEALILASIVEKETGRSDERAKIAGVFVSRLRKGMRLETDPTVIYGMGDAYDGDIRTADLRRDTPYNTRTRAGLPPTPICLPSLASIQAALHPEVTGALFFVATGDPDGSSYFSKSYEEHQAALARYLKKIRRR